MLIEVGNGHGIMYSVTVLSFLSNSMARMVHGSGTVPDDRWQTIAAQCWYDLEVNTLMVETAAG